MNLLRVLVLVGAAALSAASASRSAYSPRLLEVQPGVTDADVYAAAVQVLDAKGLACVEKDPTAGVIISEWFNVRVGGVANELYRWHISINNGAATVGMDCQACAGSYASAALEAVPDMETRIVSEAALRASRRRRRERQAGDAAPASQPAADQSAGL